jgi:hypothetical protein
MTGMRFSDTLAVVTLLLALLGVSLAQLLLLRWHMQRRTINSADGLMYHMSRKVGEYGTHELMNVLAEHV